MATVISVSRNSNHSSYAHTPDRQTVAGWGDGELTKSKDITLSGPGILGKQKKKFLQIIVKSINSAPGSNIT